MLQWLFEDESSDSSDSSDIKCNTTKPKRDYTVENLVPVTIEQILKSQPTFCIGQLKVHMVTVVAIVRKQDVDSTQRSYWLDDHTGQIEGVLRLDGPVLDEEKFLVGKYCRAYGTVQSYLDSRIFHLHKIHPIEDFNELTVHLLEVIDVHQTAVVLFGRKDDAAAEATGRADESEKAKGTGAVPKGSRALAMGAGATAKSSRVSAKGAAAAGRRTSCHPTMPVESEKAKEAGASAKGTGAVPKGSRALAMGAGATAKSSGVSAKGADAAGRRTSCHPTMPDDSLTEKQKKVLRAITTCSSPIGISVPAIRNAVVAHMDNAELREILRYLVRENYIYSTIDDDHYDYIL